MMKAGPKRKATVLDRITAKLRTALRSQTKNIIDIGKLLIESRKHLEHGEWQEWLSENFDLSYRTALNYVSAAEYVARKSETVAHFANLAPTVLYRLAADNYSEQEEAAILAATRERRVDDDATDAICEALAPADDTDNGGDTDDHDNGGDGIEAAEEDAEIEAILGGPPPAVPPPALPPPPPDYALRDFDRAIGTLKRLMTKPSAQFARTAHAVEDLENVKSFLRAVTSSDAERASETDSEELQKMRIERAGLLSEVEELKGRVAATLPSIVRGNELKDDDLGDLTYDELTKFTDHIDELANDREGERFARRRAN